jgi:hypothetical protein
MAYLGALSFVPRVSFSVPRVVVGARSWLSRDASFSSSRRRRAFPKQRVLGDHSLLPVVSLISSGSQ